VPLGRVWRKAVGGEDREAVPPELMGRIAPTRTEGINLRGVFSLPIELGVFGALGRGDRVSLIDARFVRNMHPRHRAGGVPVRTWATFFVCAYASRADQE
jgi:hypothetical protein